MSLVSDLQEAKKLWKEVSWITKTGAIIGVFLATSSIASQSDVVFQWKGFILDAVKFYRGWVTTPLKGFAVHFGFSWHSNFLDYLVLWGLWVGGMIRVLWQYPKTRYSIFVLLTHIGTSVFLAVMMSGTYYNPSLIDVIVIISTVVVYPKFLGYSKKEYIVYYGPILISFAGVAILEPSMLTSAVSFYCV